jgi:hypothetical protein
MPYLISILVASLLFFGFLLLTAYERRRGTRLFAAARYRLDLRVARVQFLIAHIDWGAFTAHLTRTSLETVAHDAAHGTLVGVRAVERFLTHAVRSLRTRRDGALPPHQPPPSLTDPAGHVKQSLRSSRRMRPMGDVVRREGE